MPFSSVLKRKHRQSPAGGWGVIFFIDWHGWWGLTPHFGKRAGQHAEVAPARIRGGDDTVVLHRYSAQGVTLSCPVKVRACSSEGAETGSSWMMLAPVPDVTAQLGPLMTEGPGLARTCPSWIGQATSRGERGGLCHAGWTDVLEKRQLHYRDPSVSLLSPVIKNHVKGQLCSTGCPSLNAAPFSQNMTTTTTLAGWQLLS